MPRTYHIIKSTTKSMEQLHEEWSKLSEDELHTLLRMKEFELEELKQFIMETQKEHDTVSLTSPITGDTYEIDEEIADICTTLWSGGYHTTMSCQSNYGNNIWIQFPTDVYMKLVADAEKYHDPTVREIQDLCQSERKMTPMKYHDLAYFLSDINFFNTKFNCFNDDSYVSLRFCKKLHNHFLKLLTEMIDRTNKLTTRSSCNCSLQNSE